MKSNALLTITEERQQNQTLVMTHGIFNGHAKGGPVTRVIRHDMLHAP
jgi:hypothetical protein